MFLITANKADQLLTMSFSQRVDAAEMQDCLEQTKGALANMDPGFRLLTDLSGLEAMDLSCAVFVEQIMDLCEKRQIWEVVRVIPAPSKDIGFAIMGRFHYNRDVESRTFDKLADALDSLDRDALTTQLTP